MPNRKVQSPSPSERVKETGLNKKKAKRSSKDEVKPQSQLAHREAEALASPPALKKKGTNSPKSRSKKKSLDESKTTHTKPVKSPREQRLFDNLLKVTYEFIKGKNYKPHSKTHLIDRLKIHEEHVDLFEGVLNSLKAEGHIAVKDDKYHFAQDQESTQRTLVKGQLSVHPRGFGFVNMPSPQQDIFIPKPYINGAIDGDIVEVEFDPSAQSEKGPEGKVVAILERGRKEIAGTVMSVVDGSAYVYSSLLGEANLMKCPLPKKARFSRGDRVLVEIHSWGSKKQPESCKIVKNIGHVDDPLSDIPFAIYANDIRSEFPKAATEEAKAWGTRVRPQDMKDRLDLRDLECFTIDPDTAKDFDDAVSLEKIGNRYRLGVHIADVSHYVRPGTAIDDEAALRCNSTYFPGKCIPMIPHELSDNLCSLKANVNRLTVSVFIDLDESGQTIGWEIARSVIKSKKRFTYGDAKKILDGKKQSPHAPTLFLMVEVCKLLQEQRTKRGSVQLFMPELVLKINEEGIPTGTVVHEYDITHQMIEEFMLKANEIVAIHLARQGKDVSYRVHEEPSPESLRDFASLVNAFGYSLPDAPTPFDIQKFFQEAEGSPHIQYLSTSYIKSMRLACYSPDNVGHYGLSLEHYCHFTSPIRRYVDTIVHRLLFNYPITRDELSQISLRASERERISARAEGSVMQVKKLRYLAEKQKVNSRAQYKALISRVKPFGIYFDILDLMMEGFLHISELEDDYFIFDDNRNVLVGRYRGISYRAGDEIVVMCKSMDLITVEASWHMVGRSVENSSESQDENKSSTPLLRKRKGKAKRKK